MLADDDSGGRDSGYLCVFRVFFVNDVSDRKLDSLLSHLPSAPAKSRACSQVTGTRVLGDACGSD
jgi:hypothetical protein